MESLLIFFPTVPAILALSFFLFSLRNKPSGGFMGLLISMFTTIVIFYVVAFITISFLYWFRDDFSMGKLALSFNPINALNPYAHGGLLIANSLGALLSLLITKYAWDRRKLREKII